MAAFVAACTVRASVAELTRAPEVPVIFTFAVPIVADVDAVRVNVVVAPVDP
jgi:hypothetical protein